MPLIDVPGHGPVEFPDGMSDEDIAKAIKRNLLIGTKQASTPVNTDDPLRKLALGVRGVGMGAASLPLMAGDAANGLINLGIGGANKLFGTSIPKLNSASQAANNLLTAAGAPTPQTTGERYAMAANQGGAGALTMPVGGNPLMTGLSGVTGGLGGEFGSDKTGGAWWGRLLGSVAGGMAPNAVQATRSLAAGKIARATEGMTDQDWKAAQARQEQAGALGVPVTGPEALGNKDLLAKQLLVEQHPESAGTMQAFMKQRPGQVNQAVNGVLSQMGPAAEDPRILGALTQQSAADAIERGRKYAQNLAAPSYAAAEEAGISPKVSFRGQQNTASMYKQAGPYTGTPDTITGDPLIQYAVNAVRSDPANRVAKDLANDSLPVLDLAKKWLNAQADTIKSGNPTDKLQGRYKLSNYTDAANKITGFLDETVPEYAVARNLYERGTASQVKPRQQGTIGDLANTADIGQQFGILKDPSKSTASTVFAAAKDLKASNPEAFQQLVRTGLQNEFDTAMKNLQSTGQEFAGARFARQIRGTPQTAQNIEAIVQELPDGRVLAKGFNNLLDVLEMTGNRLPVGSRTAFNQWQLEDMTSASIAQQALKNPVGFAGHIWENAQENFTADKLSRIFTDPESVKKMRQLAITNPQSARARALVGSIFGSQEVPSPDK